MAHRVYWVDRRCLLVDHGDRPFTDHDNKLVGMLPIEGLSERDTVVYKSIFCYETKTSNLRILRLSCLISFDLGVDQKGLRKPERCPEEPWNDSGS
jgi:hypothetical protein